MIINEEKIETFIMTLKSNEYSNKTLDKYKADIQKMATYMSEDVICKEDVIRFKEELCKKYKPRSVNSILAACNHFFGFYEKSELRVKQLKIQHTAFCEEETELTKKEYRKLLKATKECANTKMFLIMQTLGNTGIRISELPFITVEAVKNGKAEIRLKGKNRVILISSKLRGMLKRYAKKNNITTGAIFITKNGKCLDRSNIWKKMKYYAKMANVNPDKVFPHNFRHLFARQFYGIKKDIAQLADMLGHSNINTTRIYIISSGEEHKRILEKMQLLL